MTDVSTPMRADARRNHDLLLEAAAAAFAEHGNGVALETIAKQAQVGVGTLYRHFPTRESLIEAVYRSQLELLCDAVAPLLDRIQADELDAAQALRAWMDSYVQYAATKRGLGDALRTIVVASPDMRAKVCGMLETAIDQFLVVGARDGSLRSDAQAADIFRAMSAVWLIPDEDGWADQAGRIFDLLLDGLRPR
jgi:AcrR family transcriptional regulator